ncbi:MAG: TonB-dependent receptor [Proteobacteria bacterium]|nr:TonB-dependent receptor [Pseudomonadota bacterium]
MILNKPDLTHLEGKLDAEVSSTEGAAGSYGLQGAVNVPVIDGALGARLVGGYRSNGGFIDNVTRGQKNANGSDQYSVRALVLGQPTEKISAEVLMILSKEHIGEYNQVTEGLGDLQLASPEDRHNNQRSEIYALTLTDDLGFATLSSATAHYSQSRDQVDHYTGLAQSFFDTFGPVTQSPYFLGESTKAWTEELRLVSNKGSRADWVLGAFYRDKIRDSDFYLFVGPTDLPAVNTGLVASGNDPLPGDGRYIRQTIEDHYRQTAVYGEATIPLSQRIKLTGGARWFREDVSNVTGSYGWSVTSFNNGPDFTAKTSDSGFVPKASIAFAATPDQLYYALISKGYRASTINTNVTVGLGGVAASPDSLWNYEVGAKTSWADKRVTLNASAYYVKWSNIQIVLSGYSPAYQTYLGYVSNGGDAEIVGGEVSLTAAPTRALSLAASIGYTHSRMSRVTNDAILGAELPNSPPLTAAVSAQYALPMGANGRGYVRVDATHVDRQATQVLTTTFPDGAFIDGYTTGSVRLGYDRTRGWGTSLFVDNVTNVRGQLGRGIAGFGSVLDPERITVLRPRTFGVAVHLDF